jgi:hypothetical protein
MNSVLVLVLYIGMYGWMDIFGCIILHLFWFDFNFLPFFILIAILCHFIEYTFECLVVWCVIYFGENNVA